MSMVFAVDAKRRPLAPCHPGHARLLLTSGKAAVWRRYPFVLILKRALPDAVPTLVRLKIDPGSKVTGVAVVNDATRRVVWAADLTHRGQRVHEALLARVALGRGRRQRHTRSRPARLAIRATGSCNIKTRTGTVQGISVRYCRALHRGDRYTYQKGEAVLFPHA